MKPPEHRELWHAAGSLPVRGRGLKLLKEVSQLTVGRSLPVRGRGLKRLRDDEPRRNFRSLPVRGRGLKQNDKRIFYGQSLGRSPCGGVD